MPISNKRFFQNYQANLLTLTIDRRGFTITNSRLGYAKLGPGAGMVDALPGFTSIAITHAAGVKDGAFLEPQVSSLSLASKRADLFSTYDGERITLKYNGVTLFDGYVETSSLSMTVDVESRKEVAVVSMTARSFDASTYQTPPVLGAATVYGTPENPGNSVVPGRDPESVYARARAVTGEAIYSEDLIANAQADERLGVLDSADQDNQGAMLVDMAHRAGLLVDMLGVTPTWRAYELVPSWRVSDADVVTYGLETDDESPGALVYTRAQNNLDAIGYSASGRDKITREVSTDDTTRYGLAAAAAVTPLRKTRHVYLSAITLPFSSGVPLVSRLPLRLTYQRPTRSYRGAVIGMRHSISPESWRVAVDCAPVHLVTRTSDVTPARVQHLRATAGAGTISLAWTPTPLVCQATAAGTTTTLKTTDAAALDVAVGDQVYVATSAGARKDQHVLTVLSKTSSSGVTTIAWDWPIAAATVAGDQLCLADFGITASTWTVLAKPGASSQVYPGDAGVVRQNVAAASATLTGLAPGSWAVTVIATTPDGFRSPPSARTILTVT
jgi:hypothetical protein